MFIICVVAKGSGLGVYLLCIYVYKPNLSFNTLVKLNPRCTLFISIRIILLLNRWLKRAIARVLKDMYKLKHLTKIYKIPPKKYKNCMSWKQKLKFRISL